MSFQTEADVCLEEARRHIDNAITSLSKIVVERVDGHDRYLPDYYEEINTSFFELIKIRDKI